MLLYRLIHPDWEDDWSITLLKSDPEKYFDIENKYIYALITLIEFSDYEALNVRGLINYEFMEYELLHDDVIEPVNTELREWYIQHSKECMSKFPDKYPDSMRQLHRSIVDGMNLYIKHIEYAFRLMLRGHIGFMLHSEFEYVIDEATEYFYIMCKKPIDNSLIKHLNEKGMIFEVCDEYEYNDVYPLIEERYEEGQVHFLTKP